MAVFTVFIEKYKKSRIISFFITIAASHNVQKMGNDVKFANIILKTLQHLIWNEKKFLSQVGPGTEAV